MLTTWNYAKFILKINTVEITLRAETCFVEYSDWLRYRLPFEWFSVQITNFQVGTDGLLSFVLHLYLLFFFSSFFISFIHSFMFHRFYFLCFIWCCIILFVILYCLFHFFLIFLFFVHSYFLLICFLILFIYFPVSSFLYLFNLVSVSQSLSFEIRLPESIRVLEACKVSGCRSFWILRLSLFPRMHAWSMIDGLLNLWTLHECGDAPT